MFSTVFYGVFDLLYQLVDMLPDLDDFGLSTIDSIVQANTIVQQGLTWLNFFVPVSTLLSILGAWVGCIAAYSAYLIFRDYFREYRK